MLVLEIPVNTGLCAFDSGSNLLERQLLITHLLHEFNTLGEDALSQIRFFRILLVQLVTNSDVQYVHNI